MATFEPNDPLVFVGFILGERVHLVPAVSALAGATALLIWLNPDIQKMIKAVDWTTLVFFMALFMVVGAIQEVGLISFIARWMTRIVGDNVVLAMFLIVFGVGTLSTLVANIPLTASMLPIVRILTNSIPGINSQVLYYALSMGAAMGGNGFLIGGEANKMTNILCPTRGGKESHPNQDFAINLAKERDAEMLFLYVSNIRFLNRSGPPMVVDIEKEMDELGDFLLSMAQERAEKSGVHAKATVRRGVFSKLRFNS